MKKSPSWEANGYSVYLEIPSIFLKLQVNYCIYNNLTLGPILNRITLTPCLFNSHFNIILKSMPGSFEWCLSFYVFWLSCVHYLHFSYLLSMLHDQTIPSSFNIQWTVEFMKLLIMPVTFFRLAPHIFLSILFMNTVNVFVCVILVWDIV